MNKTSDARLVQWTRIELCSWFDSLKPYKDRGPRFKVKLIDRPSDSRRLQPADPHVHKMLVEAARTGRRADRTRHRSVLEFGSDLLPKSLTDLRQFFDPGTF